MKYPFLKMAALLPCLFVIQAQAAPVFQLGVDNNLGFQAVGNKTGGTSIAVGDIFYGVVNLQDISSGTTTWNANNVSAPYDSFSGYFVTQVSSITQSGFPGLYSVQMGVAASDPNGVMSAGDLAAGTIMKMYTDTSTRYTTSGPTGTDIANATDGTLWASLGISGGGYWSLGVSPAGFGTSGSAGGLNFITNNTGLNWSKVLDNSLGCATPGGCQVDMKFISTFSQTAGGAWGVNINDPAVLHPVPVPAAALLLGSGLIGFAGVSMRKGRKFVG
ncbi:hypothetical protein SCT_2759 [Sulfuricella sp. T08]|uniref:VPLPA-CTERM sorting domain-containing protein n=1 Tax=Sulfuricella sp. T08 TaxID=1632857 RepID=UPI0006179675|nr:VPLPA-CTERM sorting domain-containing protein [Sulfuricella sp. T08]GAO37338.1 hypothetical protein SCT_2759 [Sulfuricella sp. T08]